MNSTLHWSRHLDRLHEVLQQDRPGIITDIDGTISPIAPTPGSAVVDPGCRQALERLAARLVVAFISGRAAEDARRMVQVDPAIYIGNHGLDRLTPEGLEVAPEAQRYVHTIQQLLNNVESTLHLPGLVVEDKGSTGSIHYRQCSNPELARLAILQAVRDGADRAGLVVTEGRQVVEIRPPLACNKGTAVRASLEEFHLCGALYLGDDTTDVDAFEALHAWQHEAQTTALAVAVASAETPPPVLAAADLHVEGVADVAALLNWLDEQTLKTR